MKYLDVEGFRIDAHYMTVCGPGKIKVLNITA